MIKASARTADGKPLFLLGLSEGNLGKLREGRPIKVDLQPLGGHGVVLIMWGKTEEDIVGELRREGMINDATKHNLDPEPEHGGP